MEPSEKAVERQRGEAGGVGGRFGRDAFIYAAGGAAVAGVNFLLLPAFSRELNPADYGLLGLLQNTSGLLVLLAVCGTNGAIQLYYFKAEDAERKRGVLGACLLWVLMAGVMATGLGAVLAAWTVTSGGAVGHQVGAVWAVVAGILPTAGLMILQEIPRLRFQAWRYAGVMIVQSLVTAGLGWWWVVEAKAGLTGVCGATLGGVLTALGLAAWAGRSGVKLVWDRTQVVALVRFGAPFVPASLALWLFAAGPRWSLVAGSDLAELGVFEIGSKIAAVVMLLNAALGQAFSPHAFDLYGRDPDYGRKVVVMFHAMSCVCLGLSVMIALFSAEFCAYILPASFSGAAPVVSLLALAGFFSVTHQVTALGISFEKKTWLISAGWAGTALSCTALAAWLVPTFGALAAAGVSLAGYAGLSGFYFCMSQRLHPLPFEYGKFAVYGGVVVVALGFLVAMRSAPLGSEALVLKASFLMLVCLVLWRFGGLAERRRVEDAS